MTRRVVRDSLWLKYTSTATRKTVFHRHTKRCGSPCKYVVPVEPCGREGHALFDRTVDATRLCGCEAVGLRRGAPCRRAVPP